MKIIHFSLLFFLSILFFSNCQLSDSKGTENTIDYYLGNYDAIQGIWTRSSIVEYNNNGEPSTYTSHLTCAITGENITITQYDDYTTTSSTIYTYGNVEYINKNNSILLTLTSENRDNQGVQPITPNRLMTFRNFVIDGTWYPDIWIRIGTGTGFYGTWESPVIYNTSDSKWLKAIYKFNEDNTVEITVYYVTNEGDIQSIFGTVTDVYSKTDTQITMHGITYEYELLTNNFLEYPLPGSRNTYPFCKGIIF